MWGGARAASSGWRESVGGEVRGARAASSGGRVCGKSLGGLERHPVVGKCEALL